MTEQEGATRLGMAALDLALTGLGQPPLAQNPNFRSGEPYMGIFPTVRLVHPNVAPFEFIFGVETEVWLGPFTEILLWQASADTLDGFVADIALLFRSNVLCEARKRKLTLTLQTPGSRPWCRITISGAGKREIQPMLSYAPLVMPPDVGDDSTSGHG